MLPASVAVLLALAVAVAVLPTWEALEFSVFAFGLQALLAVVCLVRFGRD